MQNMQLNDKGWEEIFYYQVLTFKFDFHFLNYMYMGVWIKDPFRTYPEYLQNTNVPANQSTEF